MTQKTFTIVFLTLLILGSAAIVINKAINKPDLVPSPTSDNNPIPLQSSSASEGAVPAPVSSLSPTQATQTPKQFKTFPKLTSAQITAKSAKIETGKGTIEFEIYPEATMAASSFIFLSNNHFFDGLTFHRVEAGFVIQGGDPLGNGTGGPGYQFADELGDQRAYTRGTVAMANSGPNTNGSQFFIMLADHPELPHSYTIFGKVTQGMDVVDKISVGDVMTKVTIQ